MKPSIQTIFYLNQHPYSERAGIVYGETKAIKKELKKLGCKFNPRLRVIEKQVTGWVFDIRRMWEVRRALGL